jgi:hypothetical protein
MINGMSLRSTGSDSDFRLEVLHRCYRLDRMIRPTGFGNGSTLSARNPPVQPVSSSPIPPPQINLAVRSVWAGSSSARQWNRNVQK